MEKTISVLGSGWLGLPLVEALVKTGITVKASAKSNTTIKNLMKIDCESFLLNIENFDEKLSFFKSDYLIFTVPPSLYPPNWQEQLKKILQLLRKQNSVILFSIWQSSNYCI